MRQRQSADQLPWLAYTATLQALAANLIDADECGIVSDELTPGGDAAVHDITQSGQEVQRPP